jgi:hypothetical protein
VAILYRPLTDQVVVPLSGIHDWPAASHESRVVLQAHEKLIKALCLDGFALREMNRAVAPLPHIRSISLHQLPCCHGHARLPAVEYADIDVDPSLPVRHHRCSWLVPPGFMGNH